MIVLGPSISTHHLLEGNDDDDSNIVEPSPTDNNTSMVSSILQENELQMIGEDLIHILNDIRIKCSQELGSIGAPPLLSSTMDNNTSTKQSTIATSHDTSPASNDIKTTSQQSSTYQSNLNCIYNMATTHTNLIQTMNNILETISLGTSLRLGLGPNNSSTRGIIGNDRLVARVEKNWVARQQRPRQEKSKGCTSNVQSIKSNPIAQQRQPIRLTLQKIRNILHQTIVDFAISLQEILKHTIESYSQIINSTNEWDEFVSDLQHSLQPSTTYTLTISQLTIWINHLGSFLSFILSTILDRDGSMVLLASDSPLMASVKQSIQFANERIAFLHSACPLARPQPQDNEIIPSDNCRGAPENNTASDDDDDASKMSRNQKARQAEQIIQNLQDTLDAARVSLWAFEQSYTDQDDIGNDTSSSDHLESNHDAAESDDIAWWSQFKDLMERSQATIPEFENQFLSTAIDIDAKKEEVVEKNISDVSAANKVTTECSELISAAEEKLPPTTAADVDPKHPSLPVNKTLVFSGSGTKLLNKKRIVMPIPTVAFNSVDQTRLLQDLQTRIKTMGLAEEHEVVNTDPDSEMVCIEDKVEEEKDKGSATLLSNSGNDQRQENQSCFLGVSGSLLAELSSTIEKSTSMSPEEEDIRYDKA